jgi:hypothetical protein
MMPIMMKRWANELMFSLLRFRFQVMGMRYAEPGMVTVISLSSIKKVSSFEYDGFLPIHRLPSFIMVRERGNGK